MRFLAFLFLASYSLTSFAQWSRIPSKDFPLVAPPKRGSTTYRRDFELLLREQTQRTQTDCKISEYQKHASFKVLYGRSRLLTKAEFEAVEELFERALKFTSRVASYHKKKFSRPRPFNVDSRIQPCVTRPTGDRSYPSSHTAMATVGACLMSVVFPDRGKKIQAYGNYLGYLRIRVGVHHPSDVAAGKKLGEDICARLLRERDFIEELNEL